MARNMWNPWHGCHKCSPGCKNCYVFFLDKIRDTDSNVISKNKTNFNLPLKKDRSGNFKIASGSEVATCFTSDFFLEEADAWRSEAWEIIKKRADVYFLICTKRPERILESLPSDWGEGYENVILTVTCENQQMAERRLPIFLEIPARRRFVFVAPILGKVSLDKFLESGKIDEVAVGGESYDFARECNFDWVKDIYFSCKKHSVDFDFHQTGSNFVVDGKRYKIKHHDEYSQAKKAMKILENLS